MTYIITWSEALASDHSESNLYEVEYACGRLCAQDVVAAATEGWNDGPDGERWTEGDPSVGSHDVVEAYEVFGIDTDYDVHCPACGVRLHEGHEAGHDESCSTPVVVGLVGESSDEPCSCGAGYDRVRVETV